MINASTLRRDSRKARDTRGADSVSGDVRTAGTGASNSSDIDGLLCCGGGRVPGEGEEDVVERGCVLGEPGNPGACRVDLVQQPAHACSGPICGDSDRELARVAVHRAVAQQPDNLVVRGNVGEKQLESRSSDLVLQLRDTALGHDAAGVDDGYPVGQLVGLVEVLRGEEDGHTLPREAGDYVPHRLPAARVEAG